MPSIKLETSDCLEVEIEFEVIRGRIAFEFALIDIPFRHPVTGQMFSCLQQLDEARVLLLLPDWRNEARAHVLDSEDEGPHPSLSAEARNRSLKRRAV